MDSSGNELGPAASRSQRDADAWIGEEYVVRALLPEGKAGRVLLDWGKPLAAAISERTKDAQGADSRGSDLRERRASASSATTATSRVTPEANARRRRSRQ